MKVEGRRMKVEGRSKSYKSLIIWQKAMELAKDIYSLTKNFPKEEQYGLTLQIRKRRRKENLQPSTFLLQPKKEVNNERSSNSCWS